MPSSLLPEQRESPNSAAVTPAISQHAVSSLHCSGLVQAVQSFKKHGDQVGKREICWGHCARKQRLNQSWQHRVGDLVCKSTIVLRLGHARCGLSLRSAIAQIKKLTDPVKFSLPAINFVALSVVSESFCVCQCPVLRTRPLATGVDAKARFLHPGKSYRKARSR